MDQRISTKEKKVEGETHGFDQAELEQIIS